MLLYFKIQTLFSEMEGERRCVCESERKWMKREEDVCGVLSKH